MFEILSRFELVQVHKFDVDGEFYRTFLKKVLEVQRKHTLTQVIEWRNAVCRNKDHSRYRTTSGVTRTECPVCWAELEKETEK